MSSIATRYKDMLDQGVSIQDTREWPKRLTQSCVDSCVIPLVGGENLRERYQEKGKRRILITGEYGHHHWK